MATAIAARLQDQRARLAAEFAQPGRIRSFVLDDLLPEDWARTIHAAFPEPAAMALKASLREHKYVAAQMDRYDPLLEASLYAFQDPDVVALIQAITGLSGLSPDPHLYAGGISLMDRSCFLNPHLDNSHDKDRRLYRVLNLLYYVSPDWQDAYGGHLELWDGGLRQPPRTISSRFNRLVIMETTRQSWHSVSPITHEGARCCVSNYYFSAVPVAAGDYFHVTSFRGRPEQPWRNLVLQADQALRMGLRKIFPRGVRSNPHVYKK